MAAEPGETPGEQARAGRRPPTRADRPGGALYKRLPRGPHQLDRRAVAQHQRVRIQGAMVQAVAGDGYDALSVRQVIALAGVSRRSFYEQFASKQECFLATFDVVARQQLASARAACLRTSGGTERRVEALLESCAESVACDREAASLVLLEALRAGTPGANRLRAAAAAWERLLGALLDGTPLAPTPSGTTASALLGGLHGVMAARLREVSPRPRALVADQLRWWALAPRVPADGASARRLSALLRAGAGAGRGAARGAPAGARRAAAAGDGSRSDRSRLLAAALRLAARNPVQVLSAVQISDEAALPLEAFFELFADRDDCVRAALADAGEPLLAIASGAAEGGSDWPQALSGTLASVLSHLAAHPLQARAVTMLAPAAGGDCRRDGLRLERELARALGAGYPHRGELAGEALVGALWHLVRCHLADRRIRQLPAAAAHLTLLALAPALGAEAAAAALTSPQP